MMGWGDYRFFTEVHSLAQLRPGIAVGALTGQHTTALRIIITNEHSLQSFCQTLPLDRQGQAKLAQHISETTTDPEVVLPESKYGIVYLKSEKHYGMFQTCNDWTSEGLRKAGLPTARFTAPFAFSVTWPLGRFSQN